MRIIHTSDIHLDSPLTSRLPDDKARWRRQELLSGFSRLIGEAKRLCADAVIIAGDLFDSEMVSGKAIDTALEVIAESGLSFFYLPGNHEGDALIRCARAIPKNLFIFGEDWTYFKANDVVITGRRRISEGMLDSLELSKNDKNIVVLHGQLRDRCSSPDVIGLKEASGKNIDYLALGHYHSYKCFSISGGGSAVYCGTPEGRGFDECGECGFVLIDTDGGVKHRFIPFAKRRIMTVGCDLTGHDSLSEIKAAVSSALSGVRADDIVRLELTGKRQLNTRIDTLSLQREYENGFYYFEIKDSTRLLVRKEDYLYDKSLKGEFIRLVNSREDLDGITKERIIEMGLCALMGEEVCR